MKYLDLCQNTEFHRTVNQICPISNTEVFLFLQKQGSMELLYSVAKELQGETLVWLKAILQNKSRGVFKLGGF